jgi:peptidoglycan pentaglycine glycine transferase (the first glycine)
MADIRQTAQWGHFLAFLQWKTERIGNSFVYIRKLPLLGALIKIPRGSAQINLQEIDKIAIKNRALFVKIDPDAPVSDEKTLLKFQKHGFQAENWSLAPSKTYIVDISPTEEALLRSFEKDTRYSINLAIKKGVVSSLTEDIGTFYELYKQTAKRRGFWIGSEQEIKSLYKAFSAAQKADILLTYSDSGELLAGCLMLYEKDTAYYHLAASSATHRELLAPYLTVWEAIKLSKKKGYTFFDFDGIVDSRFRETKRWAGFTHFKRGFRGHEVTFLGSFIKYYNPVFKLMVGIFGRM